MKNKNKSLEQIWQQIPPDYYSKGVSSNYLQKLWHTKKIFSFKKLTKDKQYENIMDVGCAGGYMTSKIKLQFPDSKVTGVDVFPKSISFAKKRYHDINFLVADAHNLPFKANTFDLVVCYETIEHVANPSKVLKEIKRVLKKGGTAIIAMDSGVIHFRIIWWIWENTKGRVWKDAHLHPYHYKELKKVINKSGLKIQKKYFSHAGMEITFVVTKQ